MKKTKTIYWIVTIIFSLFMAFTAIPDVMLTPEAVTFMKKLGYPDYFTVFIGVAKILGCIAIIIPGYYRVKEWAYAGLFFDLIGAIYSIIFTHGVDASLLFMALPVVIGALSYIYYHKVYEARPVA
jgi:di/tricarboxylate transporter